METCFWGSSFPELSIRILVYDLLSPAEMLFGSVIQKTEKKRFFLHGARRKLKIVVSLEICAVSICAGCMVLVARHVPGSHCGIERPVRPHTRHEAGRRH